MVSAQVRVNGSPVGLNAAATISGMPWNVTGGLVLTPSAGSTVPVPTARGWNPSTGNISERFESGTYNVRVSLTFTGTGVTNTGIRFTVYDLRPSTVLSSDLNLGLIDFPLIDHILAFVTADASTGTGYVSANNFSTPLGPNDPAASGRFYAFNGTFTGSFITPATAGVLSTVVFPTTDTTAIPFLSASITAAAGTTSTLTLNNGPSIKGRLLINGQPVGATVSLAGKTWGTATSGVGLTRVGGSAPQIGIGLGNSATNAGTFSKRIPAGTYLISAAINLVDSSGATPAGTTLYFQRTIANQVLSSDTDLRDINFSTVDHTVRLTNRDGSAASANVALTNIPSGGPSEGGTFSFYRGEVSDRVVIPTLAVPASLTVRTATTSAAILSNTTVTPSAGGLSTVVLGGAPNTVVGTGDDDGDGIPDALEAAAPNQDVNGDGVLDHLQKNVSSLPVAGSSSQYVSVTVDAANTLTNVSTVALASIAVAPPAGTTFPTGLVKFTVPDAVALGDVTVRIFVSPAIAAQLTGYAKYNEATQLWTQMPADRVTINTAAGWLDVRLTDNGIGDDDPTVGKINDPGAPLIGTIARKTGSAALATALVFLPIPTVASTTTTTALAPAASVAPAAVPTAVTPTTVPVTVPASVLVQTSTIQPAPAPAARPATEAVEPAYTGSTSGPLAADRGRFGSFG